MSSIELDKQEVSWRTVLRSSSDDNRRTARMWLLYTLFYWMFPTIVVVFGLLLARQHVKWLDLVIHGEFLIYAITMVAGSTRLIAKDVPNRGPFVSRQGFNLVSHIMIFPAIFAYGLLRYISSTTTNPYSVSSPIVVTYSVVLLLAAFIFSYMVFLIDAQRSTPDELRSRVAAEIKHAPDRLRQQFDELQHQDQMSASAEIAESAATVTTTREETREAVLIETAQAIEAAEEQLNRDFDGTQEDK